jgi:hypothetical protein
MSGIVGGMKAIGAKLAGAVKAAGEVSNEVARLRAAIVEKRRELLHASEAPVPPADMGPRIAAHVREAGQVWLDSWGKGVILGEGGLADPKLRGSVRLPWSINAAPPWGAICASDPAGAEAFLSGIVARLAYEPGPAVSGRPALIARIEADLAELELSEVLLVDEAGAAGVVIEHRPEVLERRANEARRREIEERSAAERRQRQGALDARHETRRSRLITIDADARGGARSAYLEQGRPKV